MRICKGLDVSLVPRTGLEPVHREVLVFETNASTNSAIWANLKKMVTCIEIMCQARLALEGQSYYTFPYD